MSVKRLALIVVGFLVAGAAGGVLWDLDGTLVDSAGYHYESWQEILSGRGVTVDPSAFGHWFGKRNETILTAFGKMLVDREADKKRKILTLIALILKNIYLKTGSPFNKLAKPAEDIIRRDIIETCRDAFGLVDVKATTVWTPLWGPERMSEEARVGLGYPI